MDKTALEFLRKSFTKNVSSKVSLTFDEAAQKRGYEWIVEAMNEYADLKAKEAAKNVRHQAVEVINNETFDAREKGEPLPSVGDLCEGLENKIMNIQWRDVSPFNDTK